MILLLTAALTSCVKEKKLVEFVEVGVVGDAAPLIFSNTYIAGSRLWFWTGRPGVILWVGVHNRSDSKWFGYPELMTYADFEGRNFIARGTGILTSFVNREMVVPVDTLSFAPPGKTIEVLAFVEVDWEKTAQVYVFWRMVSGTGGKEVSEFASYQRLLVKRSGLAPFVIARRSVP